jgi:hypothetical protein
MKVCVQLGQAGSPGQGKRGWKTKTGGTPKRTARLYFCEVD